MLMGQHLSDLHRPADRRRSGRGAVGYGSHCYGNVARTRLLVPPVVGEADPHLDGLAFVIGANSVGRTGRVLDIRVFGPIVCDPLVGEDRVGQPVAV